MRVQLDSETRQARAIAAIDGLSGLLSMLDPIGEVPVPWISALIDVVGDAAREAMPLAVDRLRANDDG